MVVSISDDPEGYEGRNETSNAMCFDAAGLAYDVHPEAGADRAEINIPGVNSVNSGEHGTSECTGESVEVGV